MTAPSDHTERPSEDGRQGVVSGASVATPGPERSSAAPSSPVRQIARPAARPSRRSRLALRHISPVSVLVTSFLLSLCVGVAIVVAAAVLYRVLDRVGVLASVNGLYQELARAPGANAPLPPPPLTANHVVGGAVALAIIDVVLLTVLATLGALLYNLCAWLTGGVEVTLGETE